MPNAPVPVALHPLAGLPLFEPGDDLAAILRASRPGRSRLRGLARYRPNRRKGEFIVTRAANEDPVWALVPAKGFGRAKTRLSPLLDRDERAMLSRAMLCDVLGTIASSRCFAGLLLVSGDAEVARIGDDFGAATLLEPSEAGTNAAVQCGLDHLKSVRAGSCVVIQGDLPFLSKRELCRVVATLRRHDVVLVPAARDGGTNILGLARPDLIAPQFGEASFSRHLAAASAIEVLELPGAGHDIDVPADLGFDAEPGTGIHTRAMLRRFALDGRPHQEAPFR